MNDREWFTPRRAALYATFIFVVLFANGFPFTEIPYLWDTVGWIQKGWDVVVPWVADHVLHMGFDVQHKRRIGGEPTREYIRVGIAAVLAIVGGWALALFDRRRIDAGKVDQWLRLYLRVYLVAQLFSYGFDKVFPIQFSPVDTVRLSQMFGEVTASGFLWAFMGYSTPYQIFAGLGETLAAALLCFRRTTAIGALIGAAVMGNVVMMNFAFDVGVKLHSTFYLLGLMYLAAPDVKRMLAYYLFDRPMTPVPPVPFFTTAWKNRAVVAGSGLLCAFFGVWSAKEQGGYYREDLSALKPVLYGIYDVESTNRNGATAVLMPLDSTRWTRLAVGDSRTMVRVASGTADYFSVKTDTVARRARFTRREDSTATFTLAYSRPDPRHLLLQGRIGADSVEMSLVRRDEMALPLMQPRFHWIYDRPKVP